MFCNRFNIKVTSVTSLTIAIFGLVGFALGFKPLSDPDLGWHLAGGLWIIDQFQFPTVDPLGARGSFWLCYSWLPEVIFALAYKIANFEGIFILQALVVSASTISIVIYLSSYQRSYFATITAIGLLTIFIAPLWSPRPQLLSAIFFMYLLKLLSAHSIAPLKIIPLTILWANVHVYWVFAPFLAGLKYFLLNPTQRIYGLGLSICLGFAGLIAPYGIDLYYGLFEYAFFHEHANLLIKEFAPLIEAEGMLFYLSLLLMIFHALLVPKLIREQSYFELLGGLCFFTLALMRIKFIPLYAIFVIPLILQHFSRPLKNEPENLIVFNRNKKPWTLSLLLLLLLLLLWNSLSTVSVMPTDKQALLHIGQRLADLQHDSKQVTVLNRFNDGGWLSLAFYLAKPSELAASSIKVSIDGRTLVQGDKHLADYAKIHFLQPTWLEVIQAWKPTYAVLKEQDPLISALLAQPKSWDLLFTERPWVVLQAPK